MSDNRPLGTTPLTDIRPTDGQQITYTYRFHLAGYTDLIKPSRLRLLVSTTARRTLSLSIASRIPAAEPQPARAGELATATTRGTARRRPLPLCPHPQHAPCPWRNRATPCRPLPYRHSAIAIRSSDWVIELLIVFHELS